LGWSDVYEVAVGCGYALTMLALCGIWFALHDTQRRWRWLAAASLAYGLAVAARPSLLLGAVILLVPVIQVWREKRRLWPLLAAACGPNPLEFGQRYQLPLTVHEQFRWRYLWFNIRVGFLKPAQWSGDFPFLDNIAAPAKPAGYCNLEDAFGILTSIPVVWLALAAPLAWRGREEQRRSRLRLFLGAVAALFWMCALPLIFHDSMCLRYELEYASPLVLLAAVGVFAVERAPAGRPVWRRAARCGWVLLLGYSVVFTLLVSYKVNADGHQNFGSALLIKARLDEAIAQYQKTLQMRPGSEVVHNNLANALLREGRMEDAITHYRQALQIKPDYPEARCNFGNALLQEGKVDEAIVQCQLALQLKATTSGANITLGNAFMDKGRVDDAIVQFRLALQTTPDSAIAQFNLGTALMRKGRVDDAILQFRAALKNKPDDSNARLSLGMALAQQGKIEEAILQFQMALQLKPADPAIQITLAWLLATTADASLRDGGKALELARQADLETDQQNPFVLHALAAACAETGKFSEAVETAQRALRLAQAQTNTVLAKALETELSLYRVGSPYHKQ
jgi:tetratricopeptide (TPR) repeat protein